jgi:hypothetical protein
MSRMLASFAMIIGLGLGVSANATTDNMTMTIRVVSSGFGEDAGFNSSCNGLAFGSISPGSLTGGTSICSWFDTPVNDSLWISGFTSNPGQSWLTSASCFSVTKTGASATFSYSASSGIAMWTWTSLFGFNNPNLTAPCSLVHS